MQQCESGSGTEMEQKLQLCVLLTLVEGEYMMLLLLPAQWDPSKHQRFRPRWLKWRKLVQGDQNCLTTMRRLLVTVCLNLSVCFSGQ